ncbi:MAG TPA: DUF1003 domain-containing protein [Thermodesulfobacteriota bacterium]|nr:DUF1003 domain-containing protein [Thermodesulfobacteriota bacterium]
MRRHQETVVCQICGEQKKRSEVLPGELIRDSIVSIIRRKHPDWSSSGFICLSDLNHFRAEYVQEVLETDRGELSALETAVVRSLKEHELLSKNINVEFEEKRTLGQRVADKMAEFGGSWRFISLFIAVMVIWIIINTIALLSKPFDPFPYILLNLVLSCLAAIQAPIIMMSQNRQEAKDRLRAEFDYRVNLKAELEIRHLHEKIDHLLEHQWQRLLEIQEIQMELLEEFTRKTPRGQNG